MMAMGEDSLENIGDTNKRERVHLGMHCNARNLVQNETYQKLYLHLLGDMFHRFRIHKNIL